MTVETVLPAIVIQLLVLAFLRRYDKRGNWTWPRLIGGFLTAVVAVMLWMIYVDPLIPWPRRR